MAASASRVVGSSLRHSTATHPWPTAGTNSSTASVSAIRSVRPRMSSAATAITMAPPSGTFESRRSMLPRSSANRRSGRTRCSWARRRTEPVATVLPSASAPSSAPTSASRGSRRAQNAAITRPSAGSDGRSLAECTARSARPSSTARCTSLTKTPWPPMTWSGTSRRTSPVVSTVTNSTARPVDAVIVAATAPDWPRACRDPLVARRSAEGEATLTGPSPEVEEVAHRSGVAFALRRAGLRLEPDRRLVEELRDDRLGQRLDGIALEVVEVGEPSGEPFDLGAAHTVGGAVHQRHERRGLSSGRVDEEALDLVAHDHADPLGFGGAVREATIGPVAQVVEVGEHDAVEITDRRVDVAGHPDVDDVQRP